MQMAFFSGCATRTGLGHVSLVESVRCMADLSPLHRIVLPDMALAAGIPALVALALAMALAARQTVRHAGSG
jgi:hypothetical protein